MQMRLLLINEFAITMHFQPTKKHFFEPIYKLYLSHPSEMAGSNSGGRLNTIQNSVKSQI